MGQLSKSALTFSQTKQLHFVHCLPTESFNKCGHALQCANRFSCFSLSANIMA
jgi:hypothetical protein